MGKLTIEEKAEIDRKIRENDLNVYEKRFLLSMRQMRRRIMLKNAKVTHREIIE